MAVSGTLERFDPCARCRGTSRDENYNENYSHFSSRFRAGQP
ncbi:hypothetical protein FCL38_04635 [Pseudoduganella umbonata]|uniref:Uncharacterized protein n=1 Tax=Pseudoduganella umbonata TaxID=864828 RepID=A0ABX5UG03_9BURK|nr:hypothetical protein FCL38_04635 [Pseudoduganella umbonata]